MFLLRRGWQDQQKRVGTGSHIVIVHFLFMFKELSRCGFSSGRDNMLTCDNDPRQSPGILGPRLTEGAPKSRENFEMNLAFAQIAWPWLCRPLYHACTCANDWFSGRMVNCLDWIWVTHSSIFTSNLNFPSNGMESLLPLLVVSMKSQCCNNGTYDVTMGHTGVPLATKMQL